MFEVMKQIPKIKVSGLHIRKMCNRHNLSLDYIEYVDKHFTENALVNLHFCNKYDREALDVVWEELKIWDVVRTLIIQHGLNAGGKEITILSIVLDGILYDETEEN